MEWRMLMKAVGLAGVGCRTWGIQDSALSDGRMTFWASAGCGGPH